MKSYIGPWTCMDSLAKQPKRNDFEIWNVAHTMSIQGSFTQSSYKRNIEMLSKNYEEHRSDETGGTEPSNDYAFSMEMGMVIMN